jgi:CRP-like cAMP-binding protein
MGSEELRMASLEPGSLFGGLPVIADVPNVESAIVETPCCLLELPRKSYAHLQLTRPLLAQRIARAVIQLQMERMMRLLDEAGRRCAIRGRS